jgi:uncharacterized protein involved in response to NO
LDDNEVLAVVFAGMVAMRLSTWFDATIRHTAATIGTKAFLVALLFALAESIARCTRWLKPDAAVD